VRPKYKDTHRDPDYRTTSHATFSFYSKEIGKVKLSLFNQEQKIIWTQELSAQKGINQYSWDLIIKKNQTLAPYFIHYDEFIEAGTYQLLLEKGELRQEKIFIVKEYATE
ncbi:MAG: hypothetical protein AAF696_21330, partial [Bacteroidota bacterium]